VFYQSVGLTPAKPMENGKIGGQSSEAPEPVDIKFDTGDYVSNITPHAKNQSHRPTGGVPASIEY